MPTRSDPRGGRPPRPTLHARVARTERLTPGMIRVVFDGEGLAAFRTGPFTDSYVKLQIPPPGASYRAPFDPETVRSTFPREHWPRTRTYTVRGWDAAAGELTIDFVHHGDVGVAGPWAAAARPGDMLQLSGPGGAYAPDPQAAWHLLVGDASTIPAIASALEAIEPGVPVHAVIEVAGPQERQALGTRGRLALDWVYGDGSDDRLAEAVRAMTFVDGRVHAFVHGEAAAVRSLRRHLLVDRAIARDQISISGYWKATRSEEGWREDKSEWNRLVEEDLRRS